MPVEVDIVDAVPYRKYEALAEKAAHLTELGMSQQEVADSLGTTPRTVRRALRLRISGEPTRGPNPP